jgi:hypothetical protein
VAIANYSIPDVIDRGNELQPQAPAPGLGLKPSEEERLALASVLIDSVEADAGPRRASPEGFTKRL